MYGQGRPLSLTFEEPEVRCEIVAVKYHICVWVVDLSKAKVCHFLASRSTWT
jgi:hypothetical protein